MMPRVRQLEMELTSCGFCQLSVWQFFSLDQLQKRISEQKPIIAIVKAMLQFVFGVRRSVAAFKARTCSRTPKITSADAAKLVRPGDPLDS